MPALTPLVALSNDLTVHTFSRELGELPQLLRSGEADLILMDRDLPEPGLTSVPLGTERNVLVESRRKGARTSCYLDHDPDDTTTERFFRHNGEPFAAEQRTFLDDIYGILDGVAAGWGRAVVSAHLLHLVKDVRRVPGYRPLLTSVHLVMRKSRFQSALHTEVVRTLREMCPALLDR
jgi:DNA-binding transcriptional LysR family regulator